MHREHGTRYGVLHHHDYLGPNRNANERAGNLQGPSGLRERRHRCTGRVFTIRSPHADPSVEAKSQLASPQRARRPDVVVRHDALHPAPVSRMRRIDGSAVHREREEKHEHSNLHGHHL